VGYLVALLLAALVGFLAGLLMFKVKTRWCANCGAVKGCPRCAGWVSSAGAASGTPWVGSGGRRA